MKKILITCAVVLTMTAAIIGCTTATQGRITADIVYSVYQKIAAKEGSTTAARIQALWIKLDAIESFDEISAAYTDTVTELNFLISQVKSPLVKYVLKRVKNTVEESVTTTITKTLTNEDAKAYLIAFRNELREKFGAIERCDDPSECGF